QRLRCRRAACYTRHHCRTRPRAGNPTGAATPNGRSGKALSMPQFCVRSLVLTVAVFAIMPVAHGQWLWTPQTGRFIDIDRQPKETPELQVEFARSLLIEKRYKAALRETNKFEDFYGDSEY